MDDRGRTALHIASKLGNTAACLDAVRAGLSDDARAAAAAAVDDAGNTALHAVASFFDPAPESTLVQKAQLSFRRVFVLVSRCGGGVLERDAHSPSPSPSPSLSLFALSFTHAHANWFFSRHHHATHAGAPACFYTSPCCWTPP